MIKTIFLFVLFSGTLAFSQTHKTDSLKTALKNAKHDTTRCNVLNAMIESEENDTIWPKYNDQVKVIAETQLKTTDKSSPLYNFYVDRLAGALNNTGYLSKFRGDLTKALEYYHQSLKMYEQINSRDNIAITLNNIGFIYNDQGDFNKALEYFFKNLKLYKETDNEAGTAITFNNIGIVYSDQGKLKEALEYYKNCIALQERVKNKRVLAYALNNMGVVYQKEADLRSDTSKNGLLKLALDYFQKSLKVREEIQDKRGIAISLQNIAEGLITQGKLKEAEVFAKRSLKTANELGYPDNIKRSSNVLSKIYSRTGNWKGAFEMQLLFKQMSDSVTNEVNRKASIQKGFQYEYEKKAAADSVKTFQERKVFNAQLKQERTQRFALYGGIVLVGLFGLFMFNRFKVTKKQNHLIHEQKAELQKQKELVEEHQKETLDSIHYAKRIQTALIANSDFITKHIPGNFIYFKPKDIVSGDFYWATEHHNKFYLAVCDSTGHGVPGAFMSLLNMGFLSEAVKEKNIEEPGQIFNYVRERLTTTISHDGQKDGMDGILICIDKSNSQTITYAAANNHPVLIRSNEIRELAKDKMPVGKGEKSDSFLTYNIDLEKGDALYLYTDGYADQFGGPKGKKFKYKKLNEMLLRFNNVSLKEQKQILKKEFTDWKGSQEQVDDVLVIGIKFDL